MLEVKGLRKTYGKTVALDGVDLSIGQGGIVGIFGENGAGKTTLMKCILGFVRHEGEVFLDGEKVSRKNIGRLSFATGEHSFFADITAQMHADFYKENFSRFSEKRFRGLMDFFGLPYDKKIRSLSMGQQNQFEVVMAMSQGAEYIFMDEPFAGNDLFNREDFYRLLAGMLEEHETVILSTHLIEEVSNFVDRVILVKEGKIIGDLDRYGEEYEDRNLVDIVKEFYGYEADRVSRALEKMSGDEA